MSENVLVYGNLMSYKTYVRPAARRLYGYSGASRSKHQKSVHDMLRHLFVRGASSTWEMAGDRFRRAADIRRQEKIYRRLLVGRRDRGSSSGGVLDTGLVVREPDVRRARYRLSLCGVLYCMDAQNPNREDVDRMARRHALLLPRIFGRWDETRRILGPDAYNLRILSRGIYLNSVRMSGTDGPLYELMSYIHIKYRRNFESMRESDLAEQASYWFFTYSPVAK